MSAYKPSKVFFTDDSRSFMSLTRRKYAARRKLRGCCKADVQEHQRTQSTTKCFEVFFGTVMCLAE